MRRTLFYLFIIEGIKKQDIHCWPRFMMVKNIIPRHCPLTSACPADVFSAVTEMVRCRYVTTPRSIGQDICYHCGNVTLHDRYVDHLALVVQYTEEGRRGGDLKVPLGCAAVK